MMSKFLQIGKIASVLLVSLALLSCATIIGRSSPETLNVRSSPDQARIVIDDESGMKIFEGKTPTILTLEKKKGYFSGKKYRVTLSKEGFKDHYVSVDTHVGGWYIGGNLLFGGLIGWIIVDPATGAMWTLDTNEINATLESLQVPTAAPQTLPPSQTPAAAPQPLPASPEPQPQPATQTKIMQPNTTAIVLLQDVPESLRAKMVKIMP